MNFQWIDRGAACPVVEFHDIRTEKAQTKPYIDLENYHFDGVFGAAGGVDLGQFRVENHPERLLVMKGFASFEARRKAWSQFHSSPSWPAERRQAGDLVRDEKVMLMRAVTPGDGVHPLRRGEPLTALFSELRFPEQIGNYHLWLRLSLRKAGLDPLAAFATLEAVNDVPAIPVIRHRTQHVALIRGSGPVPKLPNELRGMLRFPMEQLGLQPALSLVW